MNPFFQLIIAGVLARKRTCPKCGRDQVVPPDKIKDTVKCKFCGGELPPKKK